MQYMTLPSDIFMASSIWLPHDILFIKMSCLLVRNTKCTMENKAHVFPGQKTSSKPKNHPCQYSPLVWALQLKNCVALGLLCLYQWPQIEAIFFPRTPLESSSSWMAENKLTSITQRFLQHKCLMPLLERHSLEMDFSFNQWWCSWAVNIYENVKGKKIVHPC